MNKNEINARIAEYVLGTATVRMLDHPSFDFDRWLVYWGIPDFTLWENVEPVLMWLKNNYKFIEIGVNNKGWWVSAWGDAVYEFISNEETLPLAICVATLKLVGRWEESLRNITH